MGGGLLLFLQVFSRLTYFLSIRQIFSHMLDDYLLRTALPRLSVNKLIKLCLLADQYDMTVLRKAYVSALTDRMDVGNIIEVVAIICL